MSYPRPEDYDAEEPEAAELDALRGRKEAAELDGPKDLVALLDNKNASVLIGAANALFNLALDPPNADALLPLGALPKLAAHLEHEDDEVKASMAGVLMNICATSLSCRTELAVTRLLPALLKAIVDAGEKLASGDIKGFEPEVRKNSLGALNNLLLDQDAARMLREAGGIAVLTNLLRDADSSEARLEDVGSSLLRAMQEDVRAGEAFCEVEGLPVLVATVASPNEELQIRLCCLIFELCEQVPSARKELHQLKAIPAVLPLLSSSAEEVQEAAARAIEKMSRMPAAAVAVRRAEGIPLLIDLMSSADEGVELAAICATMNVANSDPKAAAAIRDADGLKPLVAFLTSANEKIQIAACTALLGCSRNEANKSLIRELGAIELLLKMLPFTNPRDAQAAAVATLTFLTLNEDDARILLRLQGGMKKLQQLLYANDPLLQAHAAEVFAHCAPNKESRIQMRLCDCLAPLVGLLASPHAACRLAASGALMQGTQATRTNQVKCRELGAIAPLLRLLEPPDEGPPDRELQRRGVWTLSNIACESTAAKQLRQSPSGFYPLIHIIAGGDPILQRPAAACLFNASANDLGAPTAIENTKGLPALSDALLYADKDEEHELVASSAGVILNCAAQAGMPHTIMSSQPECLERLHRCVKEVEHVPQVANAIGALMNITTESDEAVDIMLSKPDSMALMFGILPPMKDEPSVCCHVAGVIANLVMNDPGREMIVSQSGIKAIVETLESSEDDPQTTACCVALLNAGHQADESQSALACRDHILDCGGINALVTCLASENTEVKAAAAGALLNASASAGCAEAVRDSAAEFESPSGAKSSTPGFELLLRCLHADSPLVRARAAGVLFNCAAFGPDTRLEMLNQGVVKGIAESLVSAGTSDTLGAPKGCPKELAYRIHSNLIGAALNAALNPQCKAELLNNGAMAPIVSALQSPDPTVLSQASTAIAYLSDKAEPRPGSPNSTINSAEDPSQVTKTKLRFHNAEKANMALTASMASLGGTAGLGSTSGSAAPGAASSSQPPIDEDAPGARTKALIGPFPKAKVSATHDSRSKQARFVQERPEVYGRRLTTCVEPEAMDEEYVEVPSPLPSPRGEGFD